MSWLGKSVLGEEINIDELIPQIIAKLKASGESFGASNTPGPQGPQGVAGVAGAPGANAVDAPYLVNKAGQSLIELLCEQPKTFATTYSSTLKSSNIILEWSYNNIIPYHRKISTESHILSLYSNKDTQGRGILPFFQRLYFYAIPSSTDTSYQFLFFKDFSNNSSLYMHYNKVQFDKTKKYIKLWDTSTNITTIYTASDSIYTETGAGSIERTLPKWFDTSFIIQSYPTPLKIAIFGWNTLLSTGVDPSQSNVEPAKTRLKTTNSLIIQQAYAPPQPPKTKFSSSQPTIAYSYKNTLSTPLTDINLIDNITSGSNIKFIIDISNNEM